MTLRKEFLIICNHFAKLDGFSHCGSEDITNLICHVTLKENKIKSFCNFTEGSSSLYVTKLPDLVAIVIGA